MAIEINGIKYLSYEEQVQKNKEDIEWLKEHSDVQITITTVSWEDY